MTPSDINIAIAKIYGFHFLNGYLCFKDVRLAHVGSLNEDFLKSPKAVKQHIPDFYNSLDACAKFEQTLNYNQMNEYQNLHLADIIGKSTSWISTATPPQRCEAFLKLHGKWIEST